MGPRVMIYIKIGLGLSLVLTLYSIFLKKIEKKVKKYAKNFVFTRSYFNPNKMTGAVKL